jgi:hypothetical protein
MRSNVFFGFLKFQTCFPTVGTILLETFHRKKKGWIKELSFRERNDKQQVGTHTTEQQCEMKCDTAFT